MKRWRLCVFDGCVSRTRTVVEPTYNLARQHAMHFPPGYIWTVEEEEDV